MEGEEAVPSIFEINYLDCKIYQHPPCMFTLWYVGCIINAFWDNIVECFDGIMGGGGSPPPPPPEEEE